jgi:hypothetical protein
MRSGSGEVKRIISTRNLEPCLLLVAPKQAQSGETTQERRAAAYGADGSELNMQLLNKHGDTVIQVLSDTGDQHRCCFQ